VGLSYYEVQVFMKLDEIFDEVAKQMRLDFEKARKATKHPGLKGQAIEETFRTFLRSYLPKFLDISTGILVDSHGESSKQLDVILSDATQTPIFFQSGDMRVIPIECAYAVIEVKAHLGLKELDHTFENMKSVRVLDKVTQRDLPPCYFVFAATSIELLKLAEYINHKHQVELPAWERGIDTVCVLDKGVIANARWPGIGKLRVLPSQGDT
jgi:hypothetical protein